MRLSSFFKDNRPESFGRLSSAVLIGAGVLIALSEVLYCFFVNNYEIHTGLILELIMIGMGGKVVGKHLEKKEE